MILIRDFLSDKAIACFLHISVDDLLFFSQVLSMLFVWGSIIYFLSKMDRRQ
jgi:hypothetical protein